jgi:hypothetical protein
MKEREDERKILNAPEENLEDIRRFFQKGREWLQKSHTAGLSGAEFCQSYSTLMDRVLRRLLTLEKNASGERGGTDGDFSLIATGSSDSPPAGPRKGFRRAATGHLTPFVGLGADRWIYGPDAEG